MKSVIFWKFPRVTKNARDHNAGVTKNAKSKSLYLCRGTSQLSNGGSMVFIRPFKRSVDFFKVHQKMVNFGKFWNFWIFWPQVKNITENDCKKNFDLRCKKIIFYQNRGTKSKNASTPPIALVGLFVFQILWSFIEFCGLKLLLKLSKEKTP